MEDWAASSRFRESVQFICVCIESARVAQAFSHMFGLSNALNSYIPSPQYMPVGYGQLGCSGFIVSDTSGRFISRKTKAYLQYGLEAFGDVERLLEAELARMANSKTEKENDTKTGASEFSSPSSSTITKIESPSSVGNSSVDSEHEECTEAINLLLQNPSSVVHLETALSILERHFKHEEEIMKQHGGDSGGAFSALTTHSQDHERILDIGRTALKSCTSSC